MWVWEGPLMGEEAKCGTTWEMVPPGIMDALIVAAQDKEEIMWHMLREIGKREKIIEQLKNQIGAKNAD